ncbi:RNA 2'-phosphotransferase [uncultured Desulfobacter sp.]|uniref:RNA 2'-phosphotransferase n=1 Tax=uncultured Desulfobacter sp. TaxID=240139 RepID=UPI002AA7FF45|nr:RNA 2'-phosphotransferase [uncultured Desulfobacter sp.]
MPPLPLIIMTPLIKTSSKQRHEIDGNRIRALYGHSLLGKLQTKVTPPPELLYHGTSPSIVDQIMKTGLLPMGRQYVHLSVNIEIARQVGDRKDKKSVLLQINAKEAYDSDIKFYMGNDVVWLADHVSPEFIGIYKEDLNRGRLT